METLLTREQRNLARELLCLFTIDGKSGDLAASPGQLELFGRIVFKVAKRQHVQTLTQYGKSLFTALALIILTGLDEHGESVIVGAPTEEKAKIIMHYYTAHIGDSPLFAPLLAADTKIEKLRQETTKDSLVLKNGGKMQVFTLKAGNSTKGFEAAMGFGAKNVIMDEACLIPDTIEATVIRMLAGQGPDAMYIKIGNPWYTRTHFQKSYRDPLYVKLIIEYEQALKEGRISQSFINEVKGKPFFDILYECKFPSDKQLDMKGFAPLYTESLIDGAYIPAKFPLIGEKHIGVDVSHGGANFSTIVLRATNAAYLLFRERTADELILLGQVETIAKHNGVPLCSRHLHFDSIGSQALCARANELWPYCGAHDHANSFGVNVGDHADAETYPSGEPMIDEKTGKPVRIFINKRVQLAWKGHEWVQRGGKLYPQPDFDDLLGLRYKVQSDKKIKLKSKEDMADEGIVSPDVADAFNLTFNFKPKLYNTSATVQVQEEPMSSFGV